MGVGVSVRGVDVSVVWARVEKGQLSALWI